MTFCQCSGILIEPNLALYEWADSSARVAAQRELCLFRQADNLHPAHWSGVALGLVDQLPRQCRDALEPPEEVDFEMPLRRWRRNYVLALKLAGLELDGGRAEKKMMRFLNWSHAEFLIGGPATALAALYLAPNSPRKRLLRSLRALDRERAILGIRNAAWDLTYLSDFAKKVQEQDEQRRIHVLCSFDASVRRIAKVVVSDAVPVGDDEGGYHRLFVDNWPPEAARRLGAELTRLRKEANDPRRQVNRSVPDEFIDERIRDGEAGVRGWCPTVG